MWWWYPHSPTAYDDDWEDQPRQSPFHQWVLGVAVACLLVGYGASAIVRREVEFGGAVSMTLYGLNAIAYGAAWASAGMFIHCHYEDVIQRPGRSCGVALRR
jgi:hypothetical protein